MNYETIPSHDRAAGRVQTQASLSRWLLALVALLIVGGLSFYGGIAYQKNKSGTTNTAMSGANNQGGFGGMAGGRQGRRGEFGTVTAVSSSSITIENQRTDTTKTYSITANTQVTDDGSSSTASAIKTGDTVMIQTSSSGSTTATEINLNPSFGGMGGGGAGTQTSMQSTNSL